MRIAREGGINCRQLTVWLSDEAYYSATHTCMYLSQGLQAAIEDELGIELTGNLTFRIIERDLIAHRVLIQVDSDWMQPTRA
jgi:hypothetical protein